MTHTEGEEAFSQGYKAADFLDFLSVVCLTELSSFTSCHNVTCGCGFFFIFCVYFHFFITVLDVAQGKKHTIRKKGFTLTEPKNPQHHSLNLH